MPKKVLWNLNKILKKSPTHDTIQSVMCQKLIIKDNYFVSCVSYVFLYCALGICPGVWALGTLCANALLSLCFFVQTIYSVVISADTKGIRIRGFGFLPWNYIENMSVQEKGRNLFVEVDKERVFFPLTPFKRFKYSLKGIAFENCYTFKIPLRETNWKNSDLDVLNRFKRVATRPRLVFEPQNPERVELENRKEIDAMVGKFFS